MLLEIGIGREDCPALIQSNRANQRVDDRYSDASALVFIAGLGGGFVVSIIDNHVGKSAKRSAQLLKLRLSSNA
jgi:hypothetical protein